MFRRLTQVVSNLAPVHPPTAVRRIAAAGTFVAAMETLSQHRRFARGDLLGSQVEAFHPWLAKRFPRVNRALASRAFPYAVYGTQAAVSAATFLWPRNRPLRIAGGVTLAALQSVQSAFIPFGRDGADQLQQVINITMASTALIRDREQADDLALRTLALETSLSYVASGVVKAVSPVWLKGDAVAGVMRTRSYGDPRVHQLLTRYPWISTALSWSTIAIECGFPVIYVLPKPASRAYLATMTAFHLGIGQFMGLNRFVLAFGATHPAIHYVLSQRQRELAAATRPAAISAA